MSVNIYKNNRQIFKRNLKIIVRQTLRFSVSVMLLCVFVSAQKSRQPVSAEDYAKRGAARMKIAESLRNPTAAFKKYGEAIEDFNEAIGLNEDFIVYQEALGEFFKSSVEATELEQSALYLKRGECLYKTSEIPGAVMDFSKAIELDPDLAEAYLERGKVTADLDLEDEDGEETVKRAFADFDKAIEINSGIPNYHYIRGKLHKRHQNYQDALKDLDKAIEINPRFADALVLRAEVYFYLHNYEKSIADSTRGINLSKKNIEGLETRGRAFDGAGKYELAIADYTAALRLKPNDPTLYFYRASAYRDIGKTREAKIDAASEKKFSLKFWDRNAGKLPEFGNQAFLGLSKSSFEEIR